MTFERWWELRKKQMAPLILTDWDYAHAKDAWDFQQEHIEILVETIEELEANDL